LESYSIEKQVIDTYPIEKREGCCALYKRRMEAKREALRKRLMNEWEGKTKIFASIQPGEPQV
jgi:hypothetical protein